MTKTTQTTAGRRMRGRLVAMAWGGLLALGCFTPSFADVRLPDIIGNNMVLQAGVESTIWGWAEKGENVEIRPSWQGNPARVVADAAGRWSARIMAPQEPGPHRLVITGHNKITVENILCGEVWLCAGQSNMAMPLAYRSAENRGALDFEREVRDAHFPEVRYFLLSREKNLSADAPMGEIHGEWKICSPETAGDFSAVAYFFGSRLQQALHRPVGLVDTSWGGTYIEAWMSLPTLEADKDNEVYLDWSRTGMANYPRELEKYQADLAAWKKGGAAAAAKPKAPYWGAHHRNIPAGLYNARVAPLFPFSLKGVLWYQGEANAAKAALYQKSLPAMMGDWRRGWGRDDLPFLVVQLPSLGSPGGSPVTYAESRWAELREAQQAVVERVPGTGLVVTLDVGETHIHPRNKRPVGERLANLALARIYEHPLIAEGPRYEKYAIRGSEIVIYFRETKGGLATPDGAPLRGFVLAGADGKFLPAGARIVHDTIVVKSDQVPNPTAVRYGWADRPDCNLTDRQGLPAAPFRTDTGSMGWRVLFNGENLEGWESFLAKPPRQISYSGEKRAPDGEHAGPVGKGFDPTKVFTVVEVDGQPALRISGEIFGALTTREEFKDYRLRVEMRWGEKKWPPRLERARDGGILYHASGPYSATSPWLSSLELQVQEGDFGDFYAIHTRATATARATAPKMNVYDPAGVSTVFGPAPVIGRCIRRADFEAPFGDWNTIEVVCSGDRSWHFVNGHIVMHLTGIQGLADGRWQPLTHGRIQLQSEGAEWLIRKIEIRPLAPEWDPESLGLESSGQPAAGKSEPPR